MYVICGIYFPQIDVRLRDSDHMGGNLSVTITAWTKFNSDPGGLTP